MIRYSDYDGPQEDVAVRDGRVIPFDRDTARYMAQHAHELAAGARGHGVFPTVAEPLAGELWRLATQDADWSPADPETLVGRSVDAADLDAQTGELRCTLSNGSTVDVRSADREAEDDPPNWEGFPWN